MLTLSTFHPPFYLKIIKLLKDNVCLICLEGMSLNKITEFILTMEVMKRVL
jgi:hypothetical protein